jgi:tripartite-type tricarboxylate transporter receptor subunit TctC
MRKILSALGLMCAVALCHAQQTVPPLIRVVVPVAPGAGTDVLARAVVNQLAGRLGVTMIVENKPGGSGIIGANAVINSVHDGSVLLFHSSSLVTAAATSNSFPQNMLERLVPVGMVADSAMLVAVSSKLKVKTPAEFLVLMASRRARQASARAGISPRSYWEIRRRSGFAIFRTRARRLLWSTSQRASRT